MMNGVHPADTGKVYLVGAGPGDYRLITCRGLDRIGQADVIFYDRLVDISLLAFAPPEAEKVYVGKAPKDHSFSQKEISEMLIDSAGSGQAVVRLKGGDPFVFGRGGEEALALSEAGIPFEIVPGVSSVIAGPAYAGIPVTHRGLSSSFHIFTGHDPSKHDFGVLARLPGTLIFLMGRKNLEEITGQLVEHGQSPERPAALIHYGTTGEQQVITAQLGDIAAVGEEQGVAPPLLIVIGEVSSLHAELDWFQLARGRPLAKRRIMVTRPRGQEKEMVDEIEGLGGEVLYLPTIEIRGPVCSDRIRNCMAAVKSYEWILFTSRNGVHYFFELLKREKIDLRGLSGIQFGVIGPGTGQALLNCGLIADFEPEIYTTEAMVDQFLERIEEEPEPPAVLLARSDIAPGGIARRLEGAGCRVDDIRVYRTAAPQGLGEGLAGQMEERRPDMLTFTSTSTVCNFAHMVRKLDTGRQDAIKTIPAAAIGPVTAGAVREFGFNLQVVASDHTARGLVAAVREYFRDCC